MKLHSYFRSSASWRVRIALALKGLPHDYRGVHLVRNEQHDPVLGGEAQQVPALVLDGAERSPQQWREPFAWHDGDAGALVDVGDGHQGERRMT